MWTRKVLCGRFLRADYKFWFSHSFKYSYKALHPVKIYEPAVLYIININIRLTIKFKRSTSTIKAYIGINMYVLLSEKHKYKNQKSTSTVNAYINTKAFHTQPPK